MSTALIGIGSNLGDRLENVRRALELLTESPSIGVVAKSRLYASKPVGGPHGQGDYVNAAAVLETSLAPHAMLRVLQEVEIQLGRTRSQRWESRTIDLDLLLFDQEIVEDDDLTLPHPRMSFRRFVLQPAAEIAPEMVHPLFQESVEDLLEHLNTAPHYVALTGPPNAGKTTLARWLENECSCRALLEPSSIHLPSLTPGRFLEAEVELAEHRAGMLAPSQWWEDPQLCRLFSSPQQVERIEQAPTAAVSDFWFQQSQVVAGLYRPTDSTPAATRRAYYALRGCLAHYHYLVVSPKLILWLDTPAEAVCSRLAFPDDRKTTEIIHQYVQRYSAYMSEFMRLQVRTPWLRVTSDDLETVKMEAMAALDAMKPIDGNLS